MAKEGNQHTPHQAVHDVEAEGKVQTNKISM
jgi:hypothetical protein